jgi:ribonuclease-3
MSEPVSIEALEEALRYRFRDRRLLETSLTHSSFAHEAHQAREGQAEDSNERLEFLGDSVIGMVAAHLLYEAHPSWPEGDLTRALHKLVDRPGLASLAKQVALGAHLRLGKTELRSGGSAKDSILANAMEAVVAAMYLDGGVAPVEEFARRVFAPALAADAPRAERDPKTRFQEWVMSGFREFPRYQLIADSGIEGDENRFTVEVLVGETCWASGTARSKLRAELSAAAVAYEGREELRARQPSHAGSSDG